MIFFSKSFFRTFEYFWVQLSEKDTSITASSQQPGAEAFHGRVSYEHSRDSRTDEKKTWQTYTQSKSWDQAQAACGTQSGGVGVLGTIADENENDRIVNQLRKQDMV